MLVSSELCNFFTVTAKNIEVGTLIMSYVHRQFRSLPAGDRDTSFHVVLTIERDIKRSTSPAC